MRRLWELSCPVKDVLLWTSLDVHEALALADRAGVEVEIPRDVPHAVALGTHHLCHDENPFSLRLEAHLDDQHEEALRAVASRLPEEVAAWIRGDLADYPLPFAGLAWAVARDPRPAMRRVENWIVWRLQVEGLRALAFGKVEVVGVAS